MAIYKNRQKFTGDPCVGANILVKYGDDILDETILDEALLDLQTKIKEGGVIYTETLPTEDIVDTVYGVEHTISETVSKNSLTDVIGSFMYLDNDTYKPNEGAEIVKEDYGTVNTVKETDSLHYLINDDLTVFKFDTSSTYTITISETHTDFYVGNKEEQTLAQIATLENVSDEYIHKSEKGTAGGLATLDSNGKLPVSQLPTGSEIYMGTWDASVGNYPSSEGLTAGCYYRISVEGTINNILFKVNDKLYWNGTEWQQISQSESVTSVNGKKGEVIVDSIYNSSTSKENVNIKANTDSITILAKDPNNYTEMNFSPSEFRMGWHEIEENGAHNNHIIASGDFIGMSSESMGSNDHISHISCEGDDITLSTFSENGGATVSIDTGALKITADTAKINDKNIVTSVNGLTAIANGEIRTTEIPLKSSSGDIVGYIGFGQPHSPGTGTFMEDGIYIQNKGEEDSGLHIDGQKITFWTPNDEDRVLEIWDRDNDEVMFSVDEFGYADKARRVRNDKSMSGMWISARDNAVVRASQPANNGGYFPTISTKTQSGEWSIGNLSGENVLTFSYTTDEAYNAGRNEGNRAYLNSYGTIVTSENISSQLPSGNITGYMSGTTLYLNIK